MLDAGLADGNPLWQAEGHAALGGMAARAADWPHALEHLDLALGHYRAGRMTRGEADVLAQIARTAARAGDVAKLRHAVQAYRENGQAEGDSSGSYLPLLEAELHKAEGDTEQAFGQMQELLASSGDDRGPVT